MSDHNVGAEHAMPAMRIAPEPTEEELAALTGAVIALSQSWSVQIEAVPPLEDRWRSAGRREALRSPLRR